MGRDKAKPKREKKKPKKEKEFTTTGDQKTAFRFTTNRDGDIIGISELPADLLNPLGE